MSIRSLTFAATVVAFTLTLPVEAAGVKSATDKLSRDLPLSYDGTFRVDNPNGNVTIVATQNSGVSFTAERIVRGVDDDAVLEARRASELRILADGQNVVLQSLLPYPNPNSRYSISINYIIKVPRTVHVQANTGISEKVKITGLTGNVFVKNTSGEIELQNYGPTNVETSNGNVKVTYLQKPTTNLKVATVNGSVQVDVPAASSFNWIAGSLRGEILSTLGPRVTFDPEQPGKYLQGILGSGGGPKIETYSVTGSVYLMAHGTSRAQAIAQRPSVLSPPAYPLREEVRESFVEVRQQILLQSPSAQQFVLQKAAVDGDLRFSASLGNIFVGEMRGNTQLVTRAGEIILGTVQGTCDVQSYGGPINLGVVRGEINARTGAGDISVREANKGGIVNTAGGSILVGSSGGALTLISGGGDITLRRAGGAVDADTRSGDITIGFDPKTKSQRVTAKVVGGNVLLDVPPGFAADVDAIIVTSSPADDIIQSDLAGLSITTEQITGGRSKIHAVGKLNGGGQKLDLRADEGTIRIRVRN